MWSKEVTDLDELELCLTFASMFLFILSINSKEGSEKKGRKHAQFVQFL